MDILSLLKREELLFSEDMPNLDSEFRELLKRSKVLVIGGAGTIGQATSREIFKKRSCCTSYCRY